MTMNEQNAPLRLPDAGLSGPVTPEDIARRQLTSAKKGTMASAISNGLSDLEIEAVFASKFGMTPEETRLLQSKVCDKLRDESEARRPFKKAMAENRIYRHIEKASKRNNWSAVANLEAQLSRIQGTEEPLEAKVSIDARVQNATIAVLGEMTPDEIMSIVNREIKSLR